MGQNPEKKFPKILKYLAFFRIEGCICVKVKKFRKNEKVLK